MRRTLSMVMIVATALALVEPFATSAREEETATACCRPNGKHHCVMMAMMRMEVQVPKAGSPTISKVREECPMRVYLRTSGSPFNTPKPVSTEVAVCTSADVHGKVVPFVSTGFSSHTGRGPPTIQN